MNVVLFLVGFASLSVSTWTNADTGPRAGVPVVLANAIAWHEGEPVPDELRHYRKSPGDMPAPSDGALLIANVINLPLLAALAADLKADPECREDAYVQGLYVGGPTKFFAVLGHFLSADESSSPWVIELRQRVSQRHVVVSALFIEDADMPRERAIKLLDQIEHDLRSGTAWDKVYRKYADEFGYNTGDRTRVGNLGHLIVYPDPDLGRGRFVKIGRNGIMWQGQELPRRLSRLAYFDAAHLPSIMRSSPGDVIRKHSVLYDEFVLYQVEEVYPGAR